MAPEVRLKNAGRFEVGRRFDNPLLTGLGLSARSLRSHPSVLSLRWLPSGLSAPWGLSGQWSRSLPLALWAQLGQSRQLDLSDL